MRSLTTILALFSLPVWTYSSPHPPQLNYLLTARVKAGTTITVGPQCGGTRVGLPIAGGTFDGPYLNGTFLPVGIDAGLFTSDNKFYPDGIAFLQTYDGARIIFRDRGYQTGGAIYGAVTFETGQGKYDWLNTVVAVSSAVLSANGSGSGVAVDIFVVGDIPCKKKG